MRRTYLCGLFSLTFLLLATAGPAAAQRAGREYAQAGQINGTVNFRGGPGVSQSVIVYLESEAGEIIEQTTLIGNSRFRFEGLGRTRYIVRARAPGYRETSARVDLTLMPMASPLLTLIAEPTSASTPSGSAQPTVPVGTLLAPESARQEFAKGQEALAGNTPQEAVPHFQKAIEIYPEYFEAHHSLGTVYMDQQKWGDAEKELKRSLEINDKYASSYAALGALYNIQGKMMEAQPLLERSLELEPKGWQAHLELANCLFAQNRIEEAAARARQAHELNPNYPLVHIALANIALRQRDLATARQEFQHFLDLAPLHPLAAPVRAKIEQIDKALAAKQ